MRVTERDQFFVIRRKSDGERNRDPVYQTLSFHAQFNIVWFPATTISFQTYQRLKSTVIFEENVSLYQMMMMNRD